MKEIHENRTNASLKSKILSRLGLSPAEFEILKTTRPEKPNGKPNVHGTVRNIPLEHGQKEIVTITRSPFSRLLSQYNYRSWTKKFSRRSQIAKSHYSSFPDLSFDEFIEFKDLALSYNFDNNNEVRQVISQEKIGPQTVEFFEFYFQNPARSLQCLSDSYVRSGEFLNDMPKVTFLKQEQLAHDLREFLKSHGYSNIELNHIRSERRVNVSEKIRIKENWSSFGVEYVLQKERYLFDILEHFGIYYRNELPEIIPHTRTS